MLPPGKSRWVCAAHPIKVRKMRRFYQGWGKKKEWTVDRQTVILCLPLDAASVNALGFALNTCYANMYLLTFRHTITYLCFIGCFYTWICDSQSPLILFLHLFRKITFETLSSTGFLWVLLHDTQPTEFCKALKITQGVDSDQWPGFILSTSATGLVTIEPLLPLRQLTDTSTSACYSTATTLTTKISLLRDWQSTLRNWHFCQVQCHVAQKLRWI